MYTSMTILTFLLSSFFTAIAYDEIVEVQQGLIRGRLLTTPGNSTYRAFQGIPFAEPPVGKLRFQVPQAPKSWQGVLNTTEDVHVCFAIESDSPQESEDCLYLNIYTPILNNEDDRKIPVLFWIYGGGFSHGNALYSNFGPDFLIEKDIIIVTTNYRLGPFGYLSTGDSVIPGNAGLKDQKAAIKYTYDNIAAFGGDPTKITIGGQSAGAASVGYQVLHKANEGYFRGAIQESGSPLSIWSHINSTESRKYAFDLAKLIDDNVELGNNSTALLEFLQSLDAKVIDEASPQMTFRPVPVIEVDDEEAFLTERQYTLLEAGDFIRVPTLIGTNSEEEIHQAADLDTLNKTLAAFEENPTNYFPKDFLLKSDANASLIADNIKNLYLKDVPDDEKMGHMVRYLSHITFTTPMIKHADLIANYTETYFYVFSYDGIMGNVNVTIKGAQSVDHAEDTKYLFKKVDSTYSNKDLFKFPEADVLTHYRLIEMWSNFVKYLNPTPEASNVLQNITWPKYIVGDYQYVDIGENLNITAKPKSPYYESWVDFYDKWVEKPFTTF